MLIYFFILWICMPLSLAEDRVIELFFSTQADTVSQPQVVIEFHGRHIKEMLEPTNIRTSRENVIVWKADVELPQSPPISYIQISILENGTSDSLINTIYRLPISENELFLYSMK